MFACVLEDGEARAAHVLLRGRDPQIGDYIQFYTPTSPAQISVNINRLHGYVVRTRLGCDRMSAKAKKKRGRPVVRTMPEPIPDTPENIARAILTSPPVPKDGWKYRKPKKKDKQPAGKS